MDFASLLSGMGGGGFSPSSSTGQSSPFYNESGIYFQSPGAGEISGNSSDATASTNPARSSGGVNAFPDSNLMPVNPPVSSGINFIPILIGGGVIIFGVIMWVILGKK